MNRFTMIGVGLLCATVILGVSCTRIGEPAQGEHTLEIQVLSQAGSIPGNWGKLVSTSACPAAKDWIQLWFQDDAGVVRMVAYNLVDNTLADKAILFHLD